MEFKICNKWNSTAETASDVDKFKGSWTGRAICSPTLRLLTIKLLNALFKNYKKTRKEMQILAELDISYYFRKPKRKKKIEICLSFKHEKKFSQICC